MTLILAALLVVTSPSSACISCHDDSAVTAMPSTHPYAIDYARVAAGKPQRFRPPALVQDLLLDGKVECASCHSPHDEATENPFRLRSRDIVKLCTACHVLGE